MSNKPNREKSSRSLGSVTLDDVANLAGVSAITVSRAINHPDKVAEKTLTKVQDAIRQSGYVPNLLAGGLASKKTHLIAVVVPSMSNTVYAETVRYLTEALHAVGYQVFLGETLFDELIEEQLVAAIMSRRPDGIILTGTNHSENCRRLLQNSNIPVIETWDLTPTPLDVIVGFSHHNVGTELANFIHHKGYQSIGIISALDQRAQERQAALTLRLNELQIDNITATYLHPPSSFQAGRNGLAELLQQNQQLDVIYCSSDTIAQGVLAEAQARSIGIPEQMAVIGFGNQPYAAFTYPSLTTVNVDRSLVGKHAVEALLSRMKSNDWPHQVIDVGFDIIERESTRSI